MKTKYKVEDKVRVIGEKETGRIVNIGYSERMAEVIYIVDYKDCKRKVLESQIMPPPQITVTAQDFDLATEAVVKSYFIRGLEGYLDDEQLAKMEEYVRSICSDLKGALFDGCE